MGSSSSGSYPSSLSIGGGIVRNKLAENCARVLVSLSLSLS